jgi:hypothetical protein
MSTTQEGSSLNDKFDASKVIHQNLEFYHKIKPKIAQSSYTVIATLNDHNTSQLLALATGTQSSLKRYDDDIEDCHAESLLKRAYKRYVLDRILVALECQEGASIEQKTNTIHQVVKQINQQELVLFISQFPCGFIKRFQGTEPVDELTGAEIVRKPGRGQVINGKLVYVQRDSCFAKLKRWLSGYGFQGRSFNEHLGIRSKLVKMIIGDCEPDTMLDHESHLRSLSHELDTCQRGIQYELAHMRHHEFTFGSSGKQPLPVSVVWWASTRHVNPRNSLEYIADGRRLGLTKRQSIMNNSDSKTRIGDFWLQSDMAKICPTT